MDGGGEIADVRLRIDVERRVDRGLAVELDAAFAQFEAAAGKFIIAAHQFGPAGDRRIGDGAANVEIGAPFAVEAKAGHGQAIARPRLDRHAPGLGRAGAFNLLAAPIDLDHLEFGDLGDGGGAAHGEAAPVEGDVAANLPALAVGADGERACDGSGDIVALQQRGIVRLEGEVHADAANAVERKIAGAGHAAAILGIGGEAGEDQLRPGETGTRLDVAQAHAGDRTVERGIVGRERTGDDRLGKRAMRVGGDADRAGNVDDLDASEAP